MADRRFDIEILIHARNLANKMFDDAAKNVDNYIKDLEKQANRAKKANDDILGLSNKYPINKQHEALKARNQQVKQDLDNLINVIKDADSKIQRLDTGQKYPIQNNALVKHYKEVRKNAMAELDGLLKDAEKKTQQLAQIQQRFPARNAQQKMSIAQGLGLNEFDIKKIGDTGRSVEDLTKSVSTADREIKKTGRDLNAAGRELTSFERLVNNFVRNNNQRRGGLSGALQELQFFRSVKGLKSEFTGIGIAFAVKNIQGLNSVIVGLGGSLINLGGAAIGAGSALGGALAAGAFQAIGPLTILGATMIRLVQIGKILNLQQQIKQSSLHTKETNKLGTVTDALSSSEENLANAHREVESAQRDLTSARRDARRELQDLMLEEQRAVLGAEDAKRALLQAEAGGDVNAITEAQLNLREAQLKQSRSSADYNRNKNSGVEGMDQVIQARQRLASAEKQAVQATRALSQAQNNLGAATDGATAAQDRLTMMLSMLSPAERKLVTALDHIQNIYKKNFRQITDIIISSLTDAVDTGSKLFSNKGILAGFKDNAEAGASSIRQITKLFSSPEVLRFAKFFLEQGAKNVQPLTNAFMDLSLAVMRIAKAATPIFNMLVGQFASLAHSIEKATLNSGGLASFFKDGKSDLMAFEHLLSAVWDLFKAIFDPARDNGRIMINGWADGIEKFARTLQNNQGAVRKFFADGREVGSQVLQTIFAIGVQMRRAFNVKSVEALGQFLRNVLIPAFGNTVLVLGQFTKFIQGILNIPIVAKLTQFVISVTMLSRAFAILQTGLITLTMFTLKFFESFSLWIAEMRTGGASLTGTMRMLGASFIAINIILMMFGSNNKRLTGIMKALYVVLLMVIGAVAGFKLGRILQSIKWSAMAAAIGEFIAALRGFVTASAAAVAASEALTVAMAENPFGAIAAAIGLVVGGLIALSGHNKRTAVTAQDAADALDNELNSLRALRDFQVDVKDSALQLKQAQLSITEAVRERNRVEKELTKKGLSREEIKNTLAYQEANTQVKQAVIDRTRAERQLQDQKDSIGPKLRQAIKDDKAQLQTAKDRVNNAKDDLKAQQRRIKSLEQSYHETDKQARSGGRLKDEFVKLHQKQQAYSDAQKGFQAASSRSRNAIKLMAKSVSGLGATWDTFINDYITNVNGVLGSVGATPIKFHITKGKPTVDLGFFQVPLSVFGGQASGGWVGKAWQKGRDTVPTMLGKGEAVLNSMQQKVVNSSLYSNGINGLQEVFNRTKGSLHYMASGGIAGNDVFAGHKIPHAGVAKATREIIGKFPSLGVTATYDGNHVSGSDHYVGNAVDIAGATNVMNAAAQWIKTSGMARSLKQGIHNPNLSVNLGKTVPNSFWGPSIWAGHANHVHIAVAGALGKVFGGALTELAKFTVSGPNGPFKTLFSRVTSLLRRRADAYIQKVSSRYGDTGGGGAIDGPGIISGKVSTFGPPGEAAGGTAYGYSSADPGIAVNPDGGPNTWNNKHALSWGKKLARVSIGAKSAILRVIDKGPSAAGRKIDITGAGASRMGIDPRKFPTDAIGVVKKLATGFLPQFASGGIIGGPMGTARLIGAHAGEWILNPAQQARLSALIGAPVNHVKNMLGFTGGPDSYAGGGVVPNYSPNFFKEINKNIKNLGSKKSSKVDEALRNLTDENNGLFTLFTNAISAFIDRLSNRLKKATATFGPNGKPVLILDDIGQLNHELSDIYKTVAEKQKEIKKVRKALSKLNKINRHTEHVQNAAQDDVDDLEKQEKGLKKHGKSTSAINKKISKAKKALSKAKNAHNKSNAAVRGLTNTLEGLQGDVGDLASQAFQKESDIEDARFNRSQKAADLLGRSSIGGSLLAVSANSSNLTTKNNFLQGQIDSANALIAKGGLSPEQIKSLQDHIGDLNQEIADNTQTIKDNTQQIAQMTFDIQQTNNGFRNNIISSGISIVQGMGQLSGNTDTSFIGGLYSQLGNNLTSQGTQLKGDLDTFLAPFGISGVGNLTGEQLINKIISLSNIDTTGWTQDQKDYFISLINAILDNTSATIENNQQINELNNPSAQSFSSTAWQMFRQAVFNGNGGLLPKYASIVPGLPQAASGAFIKSGGLLQVHDNETVVPAGKALGGVHVTVNQAGQELDPNYLANKLQFMLNNRGY